MDNVHNLSTAYGNVWLVESLQILTRNYLELRSWKM